MSQQQRNSSFELLRIISMFLIVAHHYSVHSGFNFLEPLSVNLYYAQCLASGGKFGVNIFVLISGYFLCKSTFKWQKLIKLELQVLFYSIIIGVVFYIYSEEKSLSNLVFSFLPLYSSEYWFYKAYFVLFLLSPFLNVFINSIEKTQYQKLLVILFILWVLIPILPKIDALEMSELSWFIYLYLCAAYIRFYQNDFIKSSSMYIILALGTYLLILLSTFAFDILALYNSFFQKYYSYFYPMNSILVFLASIFSFIGFSKINIKSNKIINTFSSATFGIYLIHDNSYIRYYLWNSLFKNKEFFLKDSLYIHSFLVIFIVYLGCTLLDLIRQYLFEKPFFKTIDKIKSHKYF